MPSALEAHPLADLFPLLQGSDLDALVDDIAANGLRQPIILYGGRVLDGRNRLRACREAGVEPRFEVFSGSEDEALALVVSLNLARRHLSTPQRAVLALDLLPLERDAAAVRRREAAKEGQNFVHAEGKATEVAGRRAGVSGETVRQAQVISKSAPEVVQAMREGVVRSMPEARRLAAVPTQQRVGVIEFMRAEGCRVSHAVAAIRARERSSGASAPSLRHLLSALVSCSTTACMCLMVSASSLTSRCRWWPHRRRTGGCETTLPSPWFGEVSPDVSTTGILLRPAVGAVPGRGNSALSPPRRCTLSTSSRCSGRCDAYFATTEPFG